MPPYLNTNCHCSVSRSLFAVRLPTAASPCPLPKSSDLLVAPANPYHHPPCRTEPGLACTADQGGSEGLEGALRAWRAVHTASTAPVAAHLKSEGTSQLWVIQEACGIAIASAHLGPLPALVHGVCRAWLLVSLSRGCCPSSSASRDCCQHVGSWRPAGLLPARRERRNARLPAPRAPGSSWRRSPQ